MEGRFVSLSELKLDVPVGKQAKVGGVACMGGIRLYLS